MRFHPAEKYTIDCKKDEKIILPTAPKAARGPDVDMSKVPSKPPYTVYLGNLPYDVSDEDVIKFFRTLKVRPQTERSLAQFFKSETAFLRRRVVTNVF